MLVILVTEIEVMEVMLRTRLLMQEQDMYRSPPSNPSTIVVV